MTTKTYRLRKADMDRSWHVLDASGRPLGRLASEVSKLLLGKHKPTYEPHLPMGDHVVVVNADRVRVTGNKATEKVYYRHSGYPGGLRERTFEEQMARDPRRVIEHAVRGMLPHNSRGRELFRRLKVYVGPEHPHTAQVMAGTGARARKRAARAEVELPAAAVVKPVAAPEAPEVAEAAQVAAEPAAETAQPPARTGSLSRWRRAELDEEATRLGIEIDPGWNKADVIAAIEERQASAEAAEEQDQ